MAALTKHKRTIAQRARDGTYWLLYALRTKSSRSLFDEIDDEIPYRCRLFEMPLPMPEGVPDKRGTKLIWLCVPKKFVSAPDLIEYLEEAFEQRKWVFSYRMKEHIVNNEPTAIYFTEGSRKGPTAAMGDSVRKAIDGWIRQLPENGVQTSGPKNNKRKPD